MATAVSHRREVEPRSPDGAQLAVVLAGVADAIVVRTPAGQLSYVNEAAARLLGFDSPDALLDEPVSRLRARFRLFDDAGRPLDRHGHPMFDALDQSASTGTVWLRDGVTGHGRWVVLRTTPVREADGGLNLLVTIIQDVTELKRAEQSATESRDRLALIFDHINDQVALLSREADGGLRLVTVNLAVAQAFGVPVERLVGERLQDWLPAEAARALTDAVQAAVMTRAPVHLAQQRPHEGGLRTLDVRLVPILDADQGCRRLLMVARDVTERLHAESRLRQTEAQFRQAQKMEALGRLAGGVAHDFNNLLTAINGYCEMVLAQTPAGTATIEHLLEIRTAGERAASLTRQLLAYSRKQVLAPKVLTLNGIVADMERMLRRVIGEDILLRTDLAPDLHPVEVDPNQMHQVLLNLAVNARDAMPHGGTLTITTRNVAAGTDSLTCARREGGTGPKDGEGDSPPSPGCCVTMSVRDTGKGMPPEVVARAFEPFFTTKRVGEGTGLGLSTVYGIVEQSGGHVTVESEPGRGACFTIVLPVARRAEVPAVKLRDVLPCGGRETVLLVEDETAVRQLVHLVLESMGYRVLEAADASRALELVRAPGTPAVDLVVTDVVLPGMHGGELVERLRELDPTIRVLFMSGYADDALDRCNLVSDGAAFLPKPFSPTSLARAVRELLDQSLDMASQA